ncbi:hypothetical protein ABGV42_02035 [Paenibacillus pabuli]|uniref:hypothetical protein n=1 Tax=Paenibacillus pabuli TaxID=1472 RepID=UPI0032426ED6
MNRAFNGIIETYSGIEFNIMQPQAELIKLMDIAHALPLICVFGGQCDQFSSVGTHALNLSYLLETKGYSYRHQLLALVQSFAQAYTGQIPEYIKSAFPVVQEIENRVAEQINIGLRIPEFTADEYKIVERYNIMLQSHEAYMLKKCLTYNIEPIIFPDIHVNEGSHYDVKSSILSRFHELNMSVLSDGMYA